MTSNSKPPNTAAESDQARPTTSEQRQQIALKKIKSLVEGNNIDTASVSIASYDEKIIEFEAVNSFIPHVDQVKKEVTSAPPGAEKVHGDAALKSAIDRHLSYKTSDQSVLKSLHNEILKREDRGFFMHKQRTALPSKPGQFLYEEPCQECRGEKNIQCRKCHGKGLERCPDCHGQGRQQCFRCNGKSTVPGPNGQQEQCNECHGQGRLQCRKCHGKGDYSCPKCKTTGREKCIRCKGQGHIYHLIQVKISVDSTFIYDPETVPQKARKVIERLEDKLLTQQHVYADIDDNIGHKKQGTQKSVMDLIYEIDFPLATMHFTLDKEQVCATVFGYRAKLLDVPPFLEPYVQGAYKKLTKAAQGHSQSASLVKKAMHETQVTHDAIIGVLSHGPTKAYQLLQKKYGLALSSEYMQGLIKDTRDAINKLTTMPQILGMGLGIIPSLLIAAIYIMGLASAEAITNASIRMILDMSVLGVAMVLPFITAQLVARQSLIYALGKKAKSVIKLPKLGLKGIIGPLMGFLIFLGLCELAIQGNFGTAPKLYEIIRI